MADFEHGIFAYLPRAMLARMPEIADLAPRKLDDEPAADCAVCVKLPEREGGDGSHPWAFNPITRCCTYHPELANFLVGRALRRGGAGAERVRARLDEKSGVSALGIARSERYREIRKTAKPRYFGKDERLRCPFWVGGTHTCGIWRDRDAVCRTWFCKHEGGPRALAYFTALRAALSHVEKELALLCAETIPAPESTAPSEAWQRFFMRCAERVEAMDDGDLAGIAAASSETLARLRQTVTRRALPLAFYSASGPAREPDVPEVLVPVIQKSFFTDRGLALEGYSHYDGIEVDPRVIDFFALLDGQRAWREALAAVTEASTSDPNALTEATVRELYRVGVLCEPDDTEGESAPREALPDVVTPALERPIAVGDRVWLQGRAGRESVVLPATIFELLSRLDGQARWPHALAEANRALAARGQPSLADDMVHTLYRIGALLAPSAP